MLVVLHKHPLLLLLSCFLLLSFTRASTTLTQGDFDSTVVKGVSFVLFTSPYCGHCRVFAPTWEKLVAYSQISADVQLARVDCSVSGVLCNAHGVVGYPQMNLYRDGAFVEEYRGNRDFSLLVEYLAANVPTETPTFSAPCVDTTVIQSPIKTQDEFNCTVAGGLWFIEYFTPWCINCKMFAATWETLLARARSDVRFARVDCSSSEDLCRAHGVKGYPHLNLYHDGDFVDTYYGHRDSEMLIASHLFTEYLTEYLAAAAPTPPPSVPPPRASTEVGGIDPPPVIELTRDTYRTAMAAPILVIATVGTDTEESVAARLREVALEWSLRHLSGRSVQFLWAKPTSNDGAVRGPSRNADVFVHIVDHEVRRPHSGPFPTKYRLLF
ncbi:thioredoxin-like protein [Mycena albidolilacea]|uniref:Thioredoxin-like protein n=1 Tax=Mycena albidolilacea TaxID=1033008 RepID=A0AAD6Z5Z9_9AGAR|nr:thioredoxin-like protein [Mycena albidolilacea]